MTKKPIPTRCPLITGFDCPIKECDGKTDYLDCPIFSRWFWEEAAKRKVAKSDKQ